MVFGLSTKLKTFAQQLLADADAGSDPIVGCVHAKENLRSSYPKNLNLPSMLVVNMVFASIRFSVAVELGLSVTAKSVFVLISWIL